MSNSAPKLNPEPGWTEVWPFPFHEARRSFTGPAGLEGIGIRYFRHPDGSLIAKVWFGRSSEGAPGRAHGGALLTVLDEAMGAAAWVAGIPVFTARLNTVFRRGVPLETELLVETRLLQKGGRTIRVSGTITDYTGKRYTEAEGVFAKLSPDRIRETFGRTDPSAIFRQRSSPETRN